MIKKKDLECSINRLEETVEALLFKVDHPIGEVARNFYGHLIFKYVTNGTKKTVFLDTARDYTSYSIQDGIGCYFVFVNEATQKEGVSNVIGWMVTKESGDVIKYDFDNKGIDIPSLAWTLF